MAACFKVDALKGTITEAESDGNVRDGNESKIKTQGTRF
jgi:hypothetical protein